MRLFKSQSKSAFCIIFSLFLIDKNENSVLAGWSWLCNGRQATGSTVRLPIKLFNVMISI